MKLIKSISIEFTIEPQPDATLVISEEILRADVPRFVLRREQHPELFRYLVDRLKSETEALGVPTD